MAAPAKARASTPVADKESMEALLFREADLLDQRDYSGWLGLYTPDCRYWLPLEEGQTSPRDTVSLIYDDRKLLETRIRRLSHPRIHAQAPHSRTVHVIGNVQYDGASEAGALIVRSNQMITEYRQNATRLFAGHVTHHLVQQGNELKISLKRIDSEGEHRGIPIIL
jgi:3-phenylpropionate/cinnamic acid dioxygenase small subunit